MKRIISLQLIFLSIFLTSCSQETDLTLRSNERWDIKSVISLNFGILPGLSGDIEGIGIKFDTGAISASAFEQSMNMVVSSCEARGMEASWRSGRVRSEGETAYTITIKGRGWQQLSNLMTPGPTLNNTIGSLGTQQLLYSISVTDVGNGQIQFVMELPQGMASLGMLFPYTFRLHGGKIISSNANYVRGGVATWVNPQGRLEAVITPASPGSLAIAWIVCGLFAVIIVGFVITQIQRKRKQRLEVEGSFATELTWTNLDCPYEGKKKGSWFRKNKDKDYFDQGNW